MIPSDGSIIPLGYSHVMFLYEISITHFDVIYLVSLPAAPPSEVRNLTVQFFDQSLVNLTWLPPENLGGRADLNYRVDCAGCGPAVNFRPQKQGFNTTKYDQVSASCGKFWLLMYYGCFLCFWSWVNKHLRGHYDSFLRGCLGDVHGISLRIFLTLIFEVTLYAFDNCFHFSSDKLRLHLRTKFVSTGIHLWNAILSLWLPLCYRIIILSAPSHCFHS